MANDPGYIVLVGPLELLLLAALCGVVGFVAWRKFLAARATDRFLKGQYDVVSDKDLLAARESIAVPLRRTREWDELLDQLRQQPGFVPRRAHIMWLMKVVRGESRPTPLPAFTPPPGKPYRVLSDPGIAHFSRFMADKAGGRLHDAFEHLRKGVALDSALCTQAYAMALIQGDVPGLLADPSAVVLLEKARSLGSDDVDLNLGLLLLEGVHLPQDLSRGLALLESTWDEGHREVAADLAAVYGLGRYGVPVQPERELLWGLRAAPQWRRWAHRLGWSQQAWIKAMVRDLVDAEERFKALPHHVKMRGVQEMLRSVNER